VRGQKGQGIEANTSVPRHIKHGSWEVVVAGIVTRVVAFVAQAGQQISAAGDAISNTL
jgi:hypothetical protein